MKQTFAGHDSKHAMKSVEQTNMKNDSDCYIVEFRKLIDKKHIVI